MVTPLKTQVQILGSTRPGVPRSPLADARGYDSASSSPLVGQQAHGHSLPVAARLHPLMSCADGTVSEPVNLFLSVLRLQVESGLPCGPFVDQLNGMDTLSLAAVLEENQSGLGKRAVTFRKCGPLNF
jgi:hypothetical protein